MAIRQLVVSRREGVRSRQSFASIQVPVKGTSAGAGHGTGAGETAKANPTASRIKPAWHS